MDHEDYLGDTLESIAREKAAIIRHGVTAVIGEQPREALNVLLDRCVAVGVQPSLDPGRDFSDFSDRYVLSLRGAHQMQNASVAVRLAESLRLHGFAISREQIGFGLANTHHPARLELIPPFLLDGAHNPAGADALRNYLLELEHAWLTLVFAAMSNKKLDQIAAVLFPLADCLVLTTVDNPRTATLELLSPLARRYARGAVVEVASSHEAVRTAITQTLPEGLICVTGSLYLLGETRPLILKLTEQTA
jgi:dihydrofolate synthase/folylpolyglutamate synthase